MIWNIRTKLWFKYFNSVNALKIGFQVYIYIHTAFTIHKIAFKSNSIYVVRFFLVLRSSNNTMIIDCNLNI